MQSASNNPNSIIWTGRYTTMTESCCNVARIAAEYDIHPSGLAYGSLDEYLVARWKGDNVLEPDDINRITNWFNRRLLSKRYEQADRKHISAEISSDYRTLQEGNSDTQEELLADLEMSGIEGLAIKEEFIDPADLRSHLCSCLGEEQFQEDSEQLIGDEVHQLKSEFAVEVKELWSSLSQDAISKAESPDMKDVVVVISCPRCSATSTLEKVVECGYVCEDHYQL